MKQLILGVLAVIVICYVIYAFRCRCGAGKERLSVDRDEDSTSRTELSSPYYTDIMHLYPGLYTEYGNERQPYCLQNHNDYAGYKNCMLYFA